MAENTKNRLTGMLLSKTRRAQYIRLFAVLAACVVVAVAIVLHQNGVAMTHEEQVLTCPVEGVVAHTHDESCYDADGNLVCTLPELELHTHTDECYDEEGNLICGQEEITEEHVHGPGCFTTVEVEDAESEEEAGSAEVAMPAQSFEDEILDEEGNLWVHVSVNAPEGAFPEGTTMRIAPLDAESVRAKVEDALNKESDGKSVAKQMKAVDITFFDAEGNEIEPLVDVEVKLTSDTVRDITDPVLVHVDKDEAKDAEILTQVNVVNQNEEDTTEGTEDTLKFESNVFSPYVIVERAIISANVITAGGETYNITVSYGEDAGIPADATLSAVEITESEEGYDELASETANAVDTDAESIEHLRMFDISIVDVNGNVLEPAAPVEVKIELVGEDINDDQELKVVHFADSGAEVINPETEGGETDTLTFTTDSFSIYSVVSWQVSSDFDGKSLAIVHMSSSPIKGTSTENKTRYLGQAFKAEKTDNGLKASNAVVELHESGRNIVTSGATGTNDAVNNTTNTINSWTFEAIPNTDNKYYLKSGNSYLRVNNNGKLRVTTNSNERSAFTVEKDENSNNIRIKYGDKYIRSSVSSDTNNNNGNPEFILGDFSAKHSWFTLCEIEQINPNQYTVYAGTKKSVQDLNDGTRCMIYKNIFDATSGQYEDYVIDGHGNLVKAYDQGDSLSLHSQYSPVWILKVCMDSQNQPSGYYVFKNEETGLILHPLADGTLVKEYEDDSPQKDGVALNGKKNGEYTSTIEHWDDSAKAFYGYQIVSDTTNGTRLLSGTGANSQDFSFAVCETNTTSGLHKVATVDSVAKGITIHMFNYPDRNTIASVTGSDGYTVGELPAQHVKAKLGSDGFPVFTNNKSGSALFKTTGNNNYKGDGNYLFLESIYNSTGYYEYSSFNNFAKYEQGSNKFTVYAEQGTPSPTSDNFYFKRGNFFPYNSLNTSANASRAQNLYNGDGKLLDYENPANGGTLYGLSGNTDYYFGMTMEFNFLMPKDGLIDNSPLIYEFNGDDDLWIYVDGVLLLDIGGVHDAWSGKIDFATGQITGANGGAGGARTIKECFKKAKVFPDGTTWDDSKVDEYFKGDTFVEYGSHTFNMFYMEHGAGASNLETRFNMPVIEKGKVEVTKELDNTSQTQYANVYFAYQMFKKQNNDYVPVTSATYKGKTGDAANVTFYDNVDIDGKNYNNVFYLKPGETAVFSDIVEDQDYYVQEIGVKSDYYDEIYVNGVKIDGTTVEAQNGVYRSTSATPRNRASVTFTNHCDNRNSNELLITKRLAQGTMPVDDTFEFRVMLENANGELVPYYQGTYYIRDDNGDYYRYDNGKLVSNGKTKYACTAGNYGTIADVPANYTVVIQDLVAGTDFYVDEIRTKIDGTGNPILIVNSDWSLVNTTVENNDAAEITNATIYNYAADTNYEGMSSMGRIAWNKDAQVTFTNQLDAANINLSKVDQSGTALSGATFTLTKWDGSDWSHPVTDIMPGGKNAAGNTIPNPVNLGSLRIGRYRLEEVSAPAGYTILENKFVYFEVYEDAADDGKLKARITDGDGAVVTDDNVASVTEDDTVVIKNTPGEELPHTGGSGTTIFYITGAAIIAAGLMYGLSARRYAMRNI